ncbi:GDSL esterase/lipase EXL3 [Ricinus communis]|uniref:GDSL esterase/lipase EXL3 n=1 Tax=Ricinus communis TaxID=3988 RepID=UPI00201AE0EF|nr:GDSL esterase/lipase EXL3 [Ricinus communis]
MEFPWFCSSSILIISFIVTNSHVRTATADVKIPAVFAFGDSLVDTGNNNYISTIYKSNFPPYGANLGVATGRFSNSKVLSDITANNLKIKDSVPPYLAPNLKTNDLLTGVTFASGGSGYDTLTPVLVTSISLEDQLKHYKEYKEKVKGIIGEPKTDSLLANSIHLVSAGSNDISDYFSLPERKAQYDVNSYTDLLVNSATTFVQSLYDTGARRIGVFSVPPIGCVPAERTPTGCAENLNRAATSFNSKLSKSLASLGARLPGSKIVFMDFYADYLSIIQSDPNSSGFGVANKACCGTGNADLNLLCNKANPTKCADISEYVFWDGYHFTEDAYMLLAGLSYGRYVRQLF